MFILFIFKFVYKKKFVGVKVCYDIYLICENLWFYFIVLKYVYVMYIDLLEI